RPHRLLSVEQGRPPTSRSGRGVFQRRLHAARRGSVRRDGPPLAHPADRRAASCGRAAVPSIPPARRLLPGERPGGSPRPLRPHPAGPRQPAPRTQASPLTGLTTVLARVIRLAARRRKGGPPSTDVDEVSSLNA